MLNYHLSFAKYVHINAIILEREKHELIKKKNKRIFFAPRAEENKRIPQF